MLLNIAIVSLNRAKRMKRGYDAVLTIEDPRAKNPLRFHRRPHPDHLVLRFEDVDDDLRPKIAAASDDQVRSAIDFGRCHASGRLLIHCFAGVSRSTAIGLAIIADRLGAGRESEAVEHLLRVSPTAKPNLHVLRRADVLLKRRGRLFENWMKVEMSDPGYAHYRNQKRDALTRFHQLFAAETDVQFPIVHHRGIEADHGVIGISNSSLSSSAIAADDLLIR